MSSVQHLSSEQALDDYFTALLSEELGEEIVSAPNKPDEAPELARQSASVTEPSVQSTPFLMMTTLKSYLERT